MRKRVGDIEEFEFHELNPVGTEESSQSQEINIVKELHVTIVISGWIKNTRYVESPFFYISEKLLKNNLKF